MLDTYVLQIEFFETILNQYLTPDVSESLKSLQGAILEKATESSSEPSDTPKHRRRATRGSDDLLGDDKHGTISPDELIVRYFPCFISIENCHFNGGVCPKTNGLKSILIDYCCLKTRDTTIRGHLKNE